MAREGNKKKASKRARFSVDTQLFRELGELLVARDSTAVVELIKNSYDADAELIRVHATALSAPESGTIIISDDGNGMTLGEFERGFLRIAARGKNHGERVSQRFGRRVTGEKGIGRLAVHKLASRVEIESIARRPDGKRSSVGVEAAIDWNTIEGQESIDDEMDGLEVSTFRTTSEMSAGTTIRLSGLRKVWDDDDLASFLSEVQASSAPALLTKKLPDSVSKRQLAFPRPKVLSADGTDTGFKLELTGDFEAGDELWDEMQRSVSWILEIDRTADGTKYVIAPSASELKKFPNARRTEYVAPPENDNEPHFEARICWRIRGSSNSDVFRSWSESVSGVRVYLEGFRVLPYGSPEDDWLRLNRDYVRRLRSLERLDVPWLSDGAEATVDDEVGLSVPASDALIGGIFLTKKGAGSLQALVNREGFVENAAFSRLSEAIRTGTDLMTRARASAHQSDREDRKQARGSASAEQSPEELGPPTAQAAIRLSNIVEGQREAAAAASTALAAGDLVRANEQVERIESEIVELSASVRDFVGEQEMLPVLASVGIQMAEFVHEVNGLIAISIGLDHALDSVRQDWDLPRDLRRELGAAHRSTLELRARLERQASLLTDVVTPSSRRRRSRQPVRERFDSARALVDTAALRKSIKISTAIPDELRTPPMFSAELTAVFMNLLTNAVKAAGEEGEIRVDARTQKSGELAIRVQNSGTEVELADAERLFRPFESSTTQADPVLGQGMGFGLPITRAIVEQYGGGVEFVKPTAKFATAIEVTFPRG
jgi:signal transduction histidine kinase